MVQANDFVKQWRDIGDDAHRVFEEVGASGWYVLGRSVAQFESALAIYWGLASVIGVASGLDALEISLRILGCRPGDRVLTTPLSAFATTLAILKLGAIPVFVDTDEQGLLDLDLCSGLLRRQPDIRFLLPVHLYGNPISSERLASLRDEFDLRIVEDCAQAIAATSNGKATGSVGQCGATSFYPTKNLGAMGDGGAILTNDAEFAAQARALRDYGQTAKYHHKYVGYNSRLDELQAALLHRVCLPRLDPWTQRRRAVARRYLADISNPHVRVLNVDTNAAPSWHLFPVFVRADWRDHLLMHLKVTGIGSGIHYPVAIPDQPGLAAGVFEMADECRKARALCASEISLPIHPYLTEQEVESVIQAINQWHPGS